MSIRFSFFFFCNEIPIYFIKSLSLDSSIIFFFSHSSNDANCPLAAPQYMGVLLSAFFSLSVYLFFDFFCPFVHSSQFGIFSCFFFSTFLSDSSLFARNSILPLGTVHSPYSYKSCPPPPFIPTETLVFITLFCFCFRQTLSVIMVTLHCLARMWFCMRSVQLCLVFASRFP